MDKYHKQQQKLIRSLPSLAWTIRVSDNIGDPGLYTEGSMINSRAVVSACATLPKDFVAVFELPL